jgi:hypothetical protein
VDGPYVVDADNLHALDGQGECAADRRVGAIGFFVADQFAQEAFPRVADQQWATEFVEFVAVTHQRDVVFVRFAEADARVEADPLA